ncbi:acyltransferase [Acidisphaera sp. L21]|uniref:acyltransferase family protein n=1 Tax=Acidisphaera sp. L21 TaxID=1641851 RepID=UPI0020B163FE|nr:acyltransferase [Acidisphaera sp. L21]
MALDHVRALAALTVFTWHFIHSGNGFPVPFAGAPAIFPLSILDEGHTGVALFMTLSGYLFAKILHGKLVSYPLFLWNRLLRLAPLLILVIAAVGTEQYLRNGNFQLWAYTRQLLKGAVLPSLPNGGWSITVEAHFYLILPVLMIASRRWPQAPLAFLAVAVMARLVLYLHCGEVQYLSYWTIVGHIDQFLLGIFAFRYRSLLCGRHALAAATGLCFAAFYYGFDAAGGFYKMGGYPSATPLWIIIPTFEGAAYSILIAYYDSSFAPSNNGISGLIGRAGAYSYSIYLLHFFVVFRAAKFIDMHVMDISNFYVACLWSAFCFCLMVPVGWVSFRYIEEPFLSLRKRYIKAPEVPSSAQTLPLGQRER